MVCQFRGSPCSKPVPFSEINSQFSKDRLRKTPGGPREPAATIPQASCSRRAVKCPPSCSCSVDQTNARWSGSLMQVLRFHIRSDQILLKIRQLLLSFSFHVILTVTSNCTSVVCPSATAQGGLRAAKGSPEVASFGTEGSGPLGTSHGLNKRVGKLQQVAERPGETPSGAIKRCARVGFVCNCSETGTV